MSSNIDPVKEKLQLQTERLKLMSIAMPLLVLVGSGVWSLGEWVYGHQRADARTEHEMQKLKEELQKMGDFIARQSSVTVQQAPQKHTCPTTVRTKISADQLSGNWQITFRSSGITGSVGIKAIRSDAVEFYGQFVPGKDMAPLRFSGHATLKGNVATVQFFTRNEAGERWHGEGQFTIDSSNLLRGWYVDQNGAYDSIDLRRSS
jgi:hypothetical protein